MILSFRTDGSGQTVQTQIRLLLEEQSDQGLHCLPFNLHILGKKPFGLATEQVSPCDILRGRLRQSFLASENLGTL